MSGSIVGMVISYLEFILESVAYNCQKYHLRLTTLIILGNCVRGTCEARVKLLFRLLDRELDKTIKASELRDGIHKFLT
jgi:hypothetical protein